MWSSPPPPPSSAGVHAHHAYFTNNMGPSIVAPAPAQAAPAPTAALGLGAAFLPKEPGAQSKAARKKSSKGAPPTWPCPVCTFNNKMQREVCEMCETPNPRAVDAPVAAAPAAVSKQAPVPTANGVGGKKGTAATAAAVAAAAAASAAAAPPPPAMVPVPTSASFRALSYENGIVTACNNLTYDEVMRRRLIGLPRANLDLITKLRGPRSAIFLLNMETRDLYGVFEAEGAGGLDLEPEAWSGSSYNGCRSSRFPAQCHFTIAADFESPLAERHYRDFLYAKDRTRIRNLGPDEVKGLIKLFQTKSKLRRVPAPPSAAAPAAMTAAAPVAAASAPVAAAPTSGANSRRNSIDSSASADEDGAKGKKGKKVVKTQQTCKRWLADECTFSDEACKFLHVATVCRAFQRGTCPKGQNCPFIHDKVDREHYRHGRSYCQKTAVHEDLKPAPAATAAGTKPKSSAPKDSLDSILSGLGSWKIASKKAEPTPAVVHPTGSSSAAAAASAAAVAAAAAAAAARDEEAEEDLAALQAAEARQDALDADEFDIGGDGGLSFDPSGAATSVPSGAGGYLDGGLSFEHGGGGAAAAWNFDAGVGFEPSGAGAQSAQAGGLDFGGDGSSMFFSPPGGPAEAAAFEPPAPVEEFAWFTNFRTHVVQPALQALVQREQQTQQKMIGPD